MVKETAGQEEFLLTTIIHFEHYDKIKKTSAVRSRISSKFIFASCVILRSCVLRVLCDLIKDVGPY